VTGDEAHVEHIKTDYRSAALDTRARAILEFAEKVTTKAPEVTADDLDQLRRMGLSDEEILDVVSITAYYNFMTRIADALGVELDEHIRDPAASRA
jgi:uncharacterized peroxidase-related enzyme